MHHFSKNSCDAYDKSKQCQYKTIDEWDYFHINVFTEMTPQPKKITDLDPEPHYADTKPLVTCPPESNLSTSQTTASSDE